jgi:hypothetical protein
MKNTDVLNLLLELRNIGHDPDPTRILNESVGYLTKYPFLGTRNFGIFRTSRHTLSTTYGRFVARKATDYFYQTNGVEEYQYLKILSAFISQYLFVITSRPETSMTSFIARFYQKPNIIRFIFQDIQSESVSILIGTDFNDLKTIKLPLVNSNDLLSKYAILIGLIAKYISVNSITDVEPTDLQILKTRSSTYLRRPVISLSQSQMIKELVDDVVLELLNRDEIVELVSEIQDTISKTSYLILEKSSTSPHTTDIVAYCKKHFSQGPEDIFIRLTLNLAFFMYNSGLFYNYYVPSVSGTTESGEAGYTFLVASLTNRLNGQEEKVLCLIANLIGSQLAFIEHYIVAEDIKFKSIGLRTLHQIKSDIEGLEGKVKRYMEERNDILLKNAAAVLERLHVRVEDLLLLEKKKQGNIPAKIDEYPSLKDKLLNLIKSLLENLLFNSRIRQGEVELFEQILSQGHYEKWIKVIGTEKSTRIETSFRIGLRELLQNCLEHTNAREGVQIILDYTSDNYITLTIINSEPMHENIVRYINEFPTEHKGKLDIGLGIPTILDVMHMCGISYHINVGNNTTSILRIPKEPLLW